MQPSTFGRKGVGQADAHRAVGLCDGLGHGLGGASALRDGLRDGLGGGVGGAAALGGGGGDGGGGGAGVALRGIG